LPATYKEGMRRAGRIIATEKLIREMDEAVYNRSATVATLAGIARYALCMPDGHSGYGFPIGGGRRMDVEQGGIISPGGIGVRHNWRHAPHRDTNLTLEDVQTRLKEIVDRLFQRVPAGVGTHGFLKLSITIFEIWVEQGARWCVERDMGWQEDLEFTEENVASQAPRPRKSAERAVERGLQPGRHPGSGNHYLEVQVARRMTCADRELAKKFGINDSEPDRVMFHCGSPRFGHQVATDYSRNS